MKILNNFLYINICLFPFFIIAGPFAGDLSLSLSSLVFLILIIIKKNLKYINNRYAILFFIWCAYLISISLLSNNILLSLESSLFHFRFGFFALAVWYCLENNDNFKKNFFISLTSAIIILIFDSFLQYFSGVNLTGNTFNINSAERLTSFFGGEGVLGSYLSRILPLFFALGLIYANKYYMPFLIFILFILTDVLVYITGERTAFFYVLLASCIFVFFIKRWKLLRFIALTCSFITIFLLSYLNSQLTHRMIEQTIMQTQILSSEDKKVFSNVHEEHYISAYKIFIDHPIKGIGPKLFREYCSKPEYVSKWSCATHPHNSYMQLLSETGLIGTFPIVLIFFLITYVFAKQFYFIIFKRKYLYSDYFICLLAALYITIWPFSPTGNFFGNWLNLIYFLPIGFILHAINNKKQCAE